MSTGSAGEVLVIVEHDRGEIAPASLEVLTASRHLGLTMVAAVCGGTNALAVACAGYGATEVVELQHPFLNDYAPEAWGEAVAQLVSHRQPAAVVACGTDRGNEVMAHVAAILDAPMVANANHIETNPTETNPIETNATETNAPIWNITRVQWGGSLLEDVTLDAAIKLVTIAHHTSDMVPSEVSETRTTFTPVLDDSFGRTSITDRVVRTAGVTLTTARVVVSGGRGVGSPEGFGPLEQLAAAMNGAVGCSRAVTNNGWRNHTDQVGQTGNRIAPDIYIPCGISGAIQHWVGAMASKKILAINTDKDANMVTRADYAVIGDLHTVVPAITAEIERRRSAEKA